MITRDGSGLALFLRDTEMSRRIRAFDWSATTLGAMETWSPSLRTAVGICLNSRFPMFVWWGADLINLYNDAYISVLGRRHPDALGRPAREIWQDIWSVVGPQAEAVSSRGEATWNERVLLVMERNGFAEDTWFTWSYSPIPDESGGIGGLFCACTEDTDRVLAQTARDQYQRELMQARARVVAAAEGERARLSEIINLAPSFMAVLRGPDHRFELANEAYLQLVGQRELLGCRVRDVFPEIKDQGFIEQLDHVYATGEPWVVRETPILLQRTPGASLEKRYIDLVFQPLQETGGAITGIFVHGLDLTERKRSEERDRFLLQLDDAIRPLEDASQITLTAATLLGQHLGADRCAYAEVEDDQDTMNLTGNYRRNDEIRSIVGRLRFRDFGEQVLRLMREDKPYVVHDIDTHDPPPDDVAAYRATQIRAVICVPLHKAGRFVAAMAVHTQTPRRWQPGEVELVLAVANRCWESIERARLTRVLRESEAELRAMAEAVPCVVWIAETDGALSYLNARWYEMTGRGPDESLGMGWIDAVHPDDRARILAARRRAVVAGDPYDGEVRYRHHHGEYRWHIFRVTPVRDDDGRIRRWYGASLDVHELREAQQAARENARRFREMADTAPAILWITEADGACSFLSRGWYEYTGQSESEALGFGWLDAVHSDDAPRSREIFLGAHARREGFSLEQRIRRHDGTYRWTIDAGRPRFGPDGEFLGYVGSVFDITERKEAEEQREHLLAAERAARTEAERLNRMKDEFLGTLSHELRTPLNAIMGWSQLLRLGSLSPDNVKQAVETIERNARAQTHLIEDLLDMSRIISGKVRLDVHRVDLAAVLEAALDSVRPTAEAKGVALERALDPDAGPVAGDASRLQQVFWNLLTNAIKFTPSGGRVQVSLQHDRTHLRVAISDTGIGMRADFLPHAFDRFRQADASTTRRHGGLGLGLSIVKQLVEMHNGTVQVASPGEGWGSTFTVTLPLLIAGDGAATLVLPPEAPGSPHTAADDPVRLTGLTVLVVDDEPDTRNLVRGLLEERGAKVLAASSAMGGLALVEKERPDVIVSDIGMPEVDGYDFIRRVRALGPERGGAPAVAVTAFARSEDRRRALLAGYQTHIAKPMDAAELVAVIASVSGRTGMTSPPTL